MAYACIDPNWGEPIIMLDTISETRGEAAKKAVISPSASLYSGHSKLCTPPIAGKWESLVEYGYKIQPVDVTRSEGSHK